MVEYPLLGSVPVIVHFTVNHVNGRQSSQGGLEQAAAEPSEQMSGRNAELHWHGVRFEIGYWRRFANHPVRGANRTFLRTHGNSTGMVRNSSRPGSRSGRRAFPPFLWIANLIGEGLRPGSGVRRRLTPLIGSLFVACVPVKLVRVEHFDAAPRRRSDSDIAHTFGRRIDNPGAACRVQQILGTIHNLDLARRGLWRW